MIRRAGAWPLFAVALAAGSCWLGGQRGSTPPVTDRVQLEAGMRWERDVKPVLDRRCVVCHACYDSPCQTELSSFEGAERGASKQPVYRGNRLAAMQPTRLFIDARTTAEWRERDFHSVIRAEGRAPLMARMLELARANPLPPDEKLPEAIGLDIDRGLECPKDEAFDAYAEAHPHGGMPYALAPLSDAEYRALLSWLAEGAPAPVPALAPRDPVAEQVRKWEDFLNGSSAKQRVTSRYLYEHLFLAHLFFPDVAPGRYYRLVRSRTPSGAEVDEIASVRPYDPPGDAPFYYRLQPLRTTLVHKTHMLYALGDARLARYRKLFLEPAWLSENAPSYDAKESANPFATFAGMPARSRYQFLLDDAQYFIMTFIKGPVCRGQIALDVIDDRFFVAFLAPDSDLSITDPGYLEHAKAWLRLPAENRSRFTLGGIWAKYFVDWRRYVDYRAERYRARDPQLRGPSLADLWDGDGRNPNALLTVFRHFDSASVTKGWTGDFPKTAWVVDYPILERIYYDLVAGFNVFGNVSHQVSTRLYMDYLRMESEDLFLSFLPPASREPIRDSWYVGAGAQTKEFLQDRPKNRDVGTRVRFATADPARELLEQFLARLPEAVRGAPDPLNRCAGPPCPRAGASPSEQRAENALARLASAKRPFARFMPDVAFVRVRVDASGARDLAYTLIHDEAHTNVAFMFGDENRRDPGNDVLTLVRGFLGSYPNFFFEVDLAALDDFVARLSAIEDESRLGALVEDWGVRRSSPRFWATADWVNAGFSRPDPGEAGIYDLNRYGNY